MANFKWRIGEFLAQKIDEAYIFFQREQAGAASQDLGGKRAQPRSNFHDEIAGIDMRLFDKLGVRLTERLVDGAS